MNKYFLSVFVILASIYSGSTAAYVYKLNNELDKPVTVTFRYKEFFGGCTKDSAWTLQANEKNKSEKVQGICCVAWIDVTPQGEAKTTVMGAAGGGIHCFDFGVTIGRKADGSVDIRQ